MLVSDLDNRKDGIALIAWFMDQLDLEEIEVSDFDLIRQSGIIETFRKPNEATLVIVRTR